MEIKEIRELLESPYKQKDWIEFLQTHFTYGKLYGDAHPIQLSDKLLHDKCFTLGNYEVDSYTKIGIFELQLKDNVNITRNRVALRNLIKELTKQVAGAMVVFVLGDKWRFSYISKRKVRNSDTNLIENKETAPKRYTYLFGKGEKALTAAQRFDKLIQKQKSNLYQYLTLDDFEDAFSVEKLSEEFFQKYKNTYDDFVQFLTGKRYTKKGNKYVETVIHEANWQLTALFQKDEKQARDFCKRMMGRIVFLYFIQKKGWLAVKKGKKWGEGNPDYLYDLYKKSKHKDDFYYHELVPLFFKTLNNTDSEKESNEYRFPYLNGGLFDDSHDKKYNKLQFPEEIFGSLLKTFNDYNFTVYEDAPDEHTVAVDPEMLGHIFENLLENNRDKGAFYTPKEIVHYMSKESLKAFLYTHDDLVQHNADLAKKTIEKILQQQELDNEETHYAEKNAYKIIDALEHVKICDPAIGSGAFPMGLLQEIFNAQIYLQEIKGFKKNVSDADIKKHIIEESIYGVDIDAGAVDIARLRFWLSLVVDEPEPQPLPNLDFKIVCANTLIPLGEIQGLDMEAKASQAVKELETIRHDFFNVSSEQKLKLERQFKKVQTDLLSLRELATNENYEIYTKLYEFNPFEEKQCNWFDAWWMFGVRDGFDIVIGNPPYLDYRKIDSKITKNKFYTKTNYNTQRPNLYIYFIERADSLLKQGGILTFINPNQFLSTDSGYGIRHYLVHDTTIISFDDVSYIDVFKDAATYTTVWLFRKEKYSPNHSIKVTECRDINDLGETTFEPLQDEIAQSNRLLIPLKEDNGISTIIESNSDRLLGDVCKMYWGTSASGYGKLKISEDEFSHLEDGLKNNYAKIIQTADIKNYTIDWKKEFIPINIFSTKAIDGFKQDKVVIGRLTKRIQAAYDNTKYFVGKSTVIINSKIPLKVMVAILNSRLVTYWYFMKFESTHMSGGYIRYDIPYLQQIPVSKFLTKNIEKNLENLVDYIMYLRAIKLVEITHQFMPNYFEQIIDGIIYELYFPNILIENNKAIIEHLGEITPLEKTDSNTNLTIIKGVFDRLNEKEHPVRRNLFYMNSIKEINIIDSLKI